MFCLCHTTRIAIGYQVGNPLLSLSGRPWNPRCKTMLCFSSLRVIDVGSKSKPRSMGIRTSGRSHSDGPYALPSDNRSAWSESISTEGNNLVGGERSVETRAIPMIHQGINNHRPAIPTPLAPPHAILGRLSSLSRSTGGDLRR